jgi:hypothetical protein
VPCAGKQSLGTKKVDIPAGCPIQQPLLIRVGEGREQNLVDACEGGVSGHVHATLAGLCRPVQAVPVLIHLVISSIYIYIFSFIFLLSLLIFLFMFDFSSYLKYLFKYVIL